VPLIPAVRRLRQEENMPRLHSKTKRERERERERKEGEKKGINREQNRSPSDNEIMAERYIIKTLICDFKANLKEIKIIKDINEQYKLEFEKLRNKTKHSETTNTIKKFCSSYTFSPPND
jgi:hypothetical protein